MAVPLVAMRALMLGAVAASAILVIFPPVLTAVGFKTSGIAAGSAAACMMSAEAMASGVGGVATGGLVATLQSIGAAGLSVVTKVAVTAATGIVAALVGLTLAIAA